MKEKCVSQTNEKEDSQVNEKSAPQVNEKNILQSSEKSLTEKNILQVTEKGLTEKSIIQSTEKSLAAVENIPLPATVIKEKGITFLDKTLRTTWGWLPTRVALGGLTLLGFVNLYMVRVNISVAIVAMVNTNDTTPTNVNPEAQCLEDALDDRDVHDYFSGNLSSSPTEEIPDLSITERPGISNPGKEKVFEWDALEQGLILASFNYGYAITQVFGGRLAEIKGTKWVFGLCILTGAIVSFLTPLMAHVHYIALISVRIALGLAQGVSYPSIHALVARWIPPLERPRFVSIVYFAATFSITLTFPFCGLVIANHGWEAVFYISGACSLFWCFFWFSCMYNDPSEHPRISEEEKNYIQQSVVAGGKSRGPSLVTPWREIATSLPMWAIIVADMGNTFALAIYINQLPTYMRSVLGFSIQKNGLLSGLPFLCRYLGAISSGILADWLLCRGYLSIVAARKLFCSIGLFGPAIFLIAVIYSGCSVTIIVILICLANFFNGSIAASQQVNHTDIAPNFSGTLFGISNTFAAVTSSIASISVGAVINDQVQTMEEWEKVFWMCVPVFVVAGSFFVLFGSGSVQPWNFAGRSEDDDALKAVSSMLQGSSTELPVPPLPFQEDEKLRDIEKIV